jgi:RNA polymerase sigma factor (TIGR02999 family)
MELVNISKDVTTLLKDWSNGNKNALEHLLPLVYDELHRIATRQLQGENPNHTIQATALVNEAYLRLVDQHSVQWKNRVHFFAISAQMMRRILVDYARTKKANKRGGEYIRVNLDEQNQTQIQKQNFSLDYLEILDDILIIMEFAL